MTTTKTTTMRRRSRRRGEMKRRRTRKEKKFLQADTRTDQPKVEQEVLADLKRCNMVATNLVICNASFVTPEYGNGMCVVWQIERKQREY